jgi:hypothetical protein
LKAVISDPNRLNSTWGRLDPIFPRGRVLDGMLLGGFIGDVRWLSGADLAAFRCPLVTSSELIPLDCDGADDASEGPMVVVQSEADIQFFSGLNGVRAGPPGNPLELDHYKVHEINSASHLDAPYFPIGPTLEFFGFDPSLTRQNPLNRSSVLRADLINLLNKIRDNEPLPPSTYMEAHGPLTKFAMGVISLDPSTGNGFGGIALPQAAAPLGLYRGIDCHSAFSVDFDITNPYHYERPPLGSGDLNTGRANFVLESSPGFPTGLMCLSSGGLEGLMTPYSVVDDVMGTRFCQSLYPTRAAYSARVVAAADDLVARRFLLPEDREAIIAEAEAQADLYPECVPPRTVADRHSRRTGARLWSQRPHHRAVMRMLMRVTRRGV